MMQGEQALTGVAQLNTGGCGTYFQTPNQAAQHFEPLETDLGRITL